MDSSVYFRAILWKKILILTVNSWNERNLNEGFFLELNYSTITKKSFHLYEVNY